MAIKPLIHREARTGLCLTGSTGLLVAACFRELAVADLDGLFGFLGPHRCHLRTRVGRSRGPSGERRRRLSSAVHWLRRVSLPGEHSTLGDIGIDPPRDRRCAGRREEGCGGAGNMSGTHSRGKPRAPDRRLLGGGDGRRPGSVRSQEDDRMRQTSTVDALWQDFRLALRKPTPNLPRLWP